MATQQSHMNGSCQPVSKSNKPGTVSLDAKGRFVRPETSFRNRIRADGSSPFPPAKGRYHLFLSSACPWCHRVMLVRKLKGLEEVISVDYMHKFLDRSLGWGFERGPSKETPDNLCDFKYLSEVYNKVDPTHTGRISVPVLWDRETDTIVSNESSEIMRDLNSEFNAFCVTKEQGQIDFYPEYLRSDIEAINEWIFSAINNGVYKCGFSTSQEAYDDAVVKLFVALDRAEAILAAQRYLVGDRVTEADLRLFPTLIRFDHVYLHLFKCNKKAIREYPNLWGYVRDLYQIGGVRETVDMNECRKVYMTTMEMINPSRIVAIGPDLDFDAPHDRATRFEQFGTRF